MKLFMSPSKRKEQRINQLIEKLRDADPQERCNAAYALVRDKDPRAAEPLGRILANLNEKPFVKKAAAHSLARFGKEALGPLNNAVKVREVYTATYAAEALGTIGDIGASEALLEALAWSCQEHDSYVGDASAGALQKISGRRLPFDLIGLAVLMREKGRDAFCFTIRENLGLPQPQTKLGNSTMDPRSNNKTAVSEGQKSADSDLMGKLFVKAFNEMQLDFYDDKIADAEKRFDASTSPTAAVELALEVKLKGIALARDHHIKEALVEYRRAAEILKPFIENSNTASVKAAYAGILISEANALAADLKEYQAAMPLYNQILEILSTSQKARELYHHIQIQEPDVKHLFAHSEGHLVVLYLEAKAYRAETKRRLGQVDEARSEIQETLNMYAAELPGLDEDSRQEARKIITWIHRTWEMH